MDYSFYPKNIIHLCMCKCHQALLCSKSRTSLPWSTVLSFLCHLIIIVLFRQRVSISFGDPYLSVYLFSKHEPNACGEKLCHLKVLFTNFSFSNVSAVKVKSHLQVYTTAELPQFPSNSIFDRPCETKE